MKLRPRDLILGLSFLFLSGSVYSQHDLSGERMQELQKLKEELEGTYQIQMVGTRKKPAIPLSLYGKIDSVRKDKELVYYKLSDRIRVKVLPRSKIEAADFEGVEENIVHIPKNTEK